MSGTVDPLPSPARRMARVATGLLLLMAAIFVAAKLHQDQYPALNYVRAFAEAAMIGALADWFAVTALFRHPLGIPIPHTAIVPRKKERIADTLGRFLQTNFLVPEVVGSRLERLDLAGAIGRRLAMPREGGGRLRAGLLAVARQLLSALDDAPVSNALRQSAERRLRDLDVATLLAQLIDSAIEGGRHGALVDALLRWLARALAENESYIRAEVRERAGWFARMAGLDEEISDRIIAALRKLLGDMAADPAHPMRMKVTESLTGIAFDLRHDAETRARVEAVRDEILAHPAVADRLDGLWTGLKASLLKAVEAPDGLRSGGLGTALEGLGRRLTEDEELREVINGHARRGVMALVEGYGEEIVSLVSDTVRGWDTEMVVNRLEGIVGRDLQYIRINGTLVGGLAGLVIYALAEALL
jgi:uncharacterized membrane-anchored protein YjiN (DUF445 family)